MSHSEKRALEEDTNDNKYLSNSSPTPALLSLIGNNGAVIPCPNITNDKEFVPVASQQEEPIQGYDKHPTVPVMPIPEIPQETGDEQEANPMQCEESDDEDTLCNVPSTTNTSTTKPQQKRKMPSGDIEERSAKRFKPSSLFEKEVKEIGNLEKQIEEKKIDIESPPTETGKLYETIVGQKALRGNIEQLKLKTQSKKNALERKMRNAWIKKLMDTIGDGMYDAMTKATVFGNRSDIEEQIEIAERKFVRARTPFRKFGEDLYSFIEEERQLKPQVLTKVFVGKDTTPYHVFEEKLQLLDIPMNDMEIDNAVIVLVDENIEREDTKNTFMQCILPYLQHPTRNIFSFLIEYLASSSKKMNDCLVLTNYIPLAAACLHMFALSHREHAKFQQMQTDFCKKILSSRESVALDDYQVEVQHHSEVFSTRAYSKQCSSCGFNLKCPNNCTKLLPLTLAHRELLFYTIVYPIYKDKMKVENDTEKSGAHYFTYKALEKK